MKKLTLFFWLSVVSCLLLVVSGCSKVSENNGQYELGGTRRLTFCLHNLMTYDIYIEVSEVSNGDWQSQNRPERLARAYTTGESFYQEMDLNTWRKTFPATFTFYRWDPVSGTKVGTALGQWRMNDLNSIEQPYIESMRTGYQGKIQVITSRGYSGVHATLVPANLPLTDWVAAMSDATYISELSWPATHDSGTYHFLYLPPVSDWVVCQARNFADTLNLGGRVFDLRLAPYSSNDLAIYHSDFNTGAKFVANFLTDCKNFLAAHPGEVVMIEFKKEHGDATEVKDVFDRIINEDAWKDLIYAPASFETFPRLGEVRGKIILIYDGNMYDSRSKGYWLDYTSDISEELTWEPSTPNAKWFVHSNYAATNPQMKRDHLGAYYDDLIKLGDLLGNEERYIMPMSSLNASHVPYSPPAFALDVNPWACGELAELDPTKRLGIVYMDFFATYLHFKIISLHINNFEKIPDDHYNGISYLLVAKNYYKHNIDPNP